MAGHADNVLPIGGTESGDSSGVPCGGDRSTGTDHAPASGALSAVPRLSARSGTDRTAETTSPDAIRAILSDLPRPPGVPTTLYGERDAAAVVDEGAVNLDPLDRALPQTLARAAAAGMPFTVLLVRPGPSPTAAGPRPPVTAGAVADLAASLSVSLDPGQQLYSAGPGYLGVVLRGRPGVGRRHATRLAHRASFEGAPLFTWAAAHYPRDATTAPGLIDAASSRLDGRLVSRIDVPAHDEEAGSGRYGAAVWGGVAAAVLFGAAAFGLHGPKTAPHLFTGSSPPGRTGTVNGSNGSNGSSVLPVSNLGADGGSPAGRSGPGGGGSSGAGSGTPGNGTSGFSPSAGQSADGPSNGTGGATSSSIPYQSVTATTAPGDTTTTVPGGGGNTDGATTTTAPTTTTTSPCSGLVQTITCTANNTLGGLGL